MSAQIAELETRELYRRAAKRGRQAINRTFFAEVFFDADADRPFGAADEPAGNDRHAGRPRAPARKRRERHHPGRACRSCWREFTQIIKGGAEGIRTPDPLTASQVRYQLRHSPLPR
jgi:hypothetical protein